MGAGNPNAVSLTSIGLYSGGTAPFDLIEAGWGPLGGGSIMIDLYNRSSSTETITYTLTLDGTSTLPTYYNNPTAVLGMPAGHVAVFGSSFAPLEAANVSAAGTIRTNGGNGSDYSSLGVYMGWNKLGGAEANFTNNRSVGGGGGFTFDDIDASNVSNRLMTIFGNGNVAIGTATPYSGAKFQTKLNTNVNLGIDAGGASGSIRLDAYNDAANANIPLELQGSSVGLYGGGTLGLLVNSFGNVGIGTASLTRKLDILSGTGVTPLAAVGPGGSILIDNVGSGQSYYQANSFHQFQGTSGNPILTMFNGGSVAIGTTDPKGYKLAVAGDAIAESMTVDLQANWPDYVFKKDYSLPLLSEVKAYIDQNQHLPGVPTAGQLSKTGINLGEMNALLMKKVEELTLYLIEKDKQDKEKEAKLQSQQKQIDELKQQITNIMAAQKNTKAQ
jgi:hypothetical protein